MRICIIGGGIIGLNIAYELSGRGDDIFLLEKEQFLGHHTSTRNSEVIHAGFAYPPDTHKAALCVEGNRLTYELLGKLDVPYRNCGKWLVVCNKVEEEALANVAENAKACGVASYRDASPGELKKAEPFVKGVTAAAHVASSGVLDVSSYIRALEVYLSNGENVNLVYPCKVTAIDAAASKLETSRGVIEYDLLINSAGLWADEIYGMVSGNKNKFQIVPFKGEYYTWRKGQVKEMIYPIPRRFLPETKGDSSMVSSMGIHIHRNVGNELLTGPSQVRLTPDEKDDYTIRTPAEDFVREISVYIDGAKAGELEPAYAGNRPKLYVDGQPYGDFLMFREGDIIHLLGMESPGLTAAPAIAGYVREMI